LGEGESVASAPIRKADVGGSSLMAEAGWKLEATPENPWAE